MKFTPQYQSVIVIHSNGKNMDVYVGTEAAKEWIETNSFLSPILTKPLELYSEFHFKVTINPCFDAYQIAQYINENLGGQIKQRYKKPNGRVSSAVVGEQENVDLTGENLDEHTWDLSFLDLDFEDEEEEETLFEDEEDDDNEGDKGVVV